MHILGHHLTSSDNYLGKAAEWLGFGFEKIDDYTNLVQANTTGSAEAYDSRKAIMEEVRVRDWGSFTTALHSLMSAHMIVAPVFYSVYDSFKRPAKADDIKYFDFDGYVKPKLINGVLGSSATFLAAPVYALYNIFSRAYNGVTQNDLTVMNALYGTMFFVKLVVSNLVSAAVEMTLSAANLAVSLVLAVSSIVTYPISGLTQLAMHKFTKEAAPASAEALKAANEAAKNQKEMLKTKDENAGNSFVDYAKNILANWKSEKADTETVKAVNKVLAADTKTEDYQVVEKDGAFVVKIKTADDLIDLADDQRADFDKAVAGKHVADVIKGAKGLIDASVFSKPDTAAPLGLVVAPSAA